MSIGANREVLIEDTYQLPVLWSRPCVTTTNGVSSNNHGGGIPTDQTLETFAWWSLKNIEPTLLRRLVERAYADCRNIESRLGLANHTFPG